MNLYPLKFDPILKSVLWGGRDICPFKGIQPLQEGIGESWEISHVADNVSVVANGSLAGTSLDELIKQQAVALLGEAVIQRSGTTFPLLIKFIDALDDLSIQVHPNDELAAKRHQSFGKTEMWYVIKTLPNAKLYSGFKEAITTEEYVQKVEDGSFTDTLQQYEVNAGDVFFLPAGRVHAIGAGCFIAEIQQTSNITYRIYDYDRKDAQGNGRELHTELAKDAIDYTVLPEGYQTHYTEKESGVTALASCQYFTTNLLGAPEAQVLQRDFSGTDSFVVYICLEGKLQLSDSFGSKVELQQGETVLVPAACKDSITLTSHSKYKVLETYVQ